nr:hypothetical protein [Haloarchaeobius litoreus]
MGSVAETVMRRASLPVTVVRLPQTVRAVLPKQWSVRVKYL